MSGVFSLLEADFEAHLLNTALTPKDAQAKKDAFQYFKTEGLPSSRLEDWKYTDLSLYALDQFRLLGPDPNLSLEALGKLPRTSSMRVFKNGIPLQKPSLASPPKPASPLRSVFSQSLKALNFALCTEEIPIDIPPNTLVEEPLYLYYLQESSEHPGLTCPRTFIEIGENSQVTVIEVYLNPGSTRSFCNAETNIHLGRNARLTHQILQIGKSDSLQNIAVTLNQCQHSHYQGHSILLGGALQRMHLQAHLNEPRAKAELYCLQMAKDRQHTDQVVEVHHHAPHAESHIVSRAVSHESAQTCFTGKIIVDKNAIKTKAHLDNKNLLLSAEAEAYTRPQLQVNNDEVECTHGATVGHLESEALFYLKSRGIPEAEAYALLIQAFIHPSLSHSLPTLPFLESLIHEY